MPQGRRGSKPRGAASTPNPEYPSVMDSVDETHVADLGAACARGWRPALELPPDLVAPPLAGLDAAQRARLFAAARDQQLRLHRFKRTQGLPRVRRVLGALRGLAPADLLDIGSGRGVFLWPLLDAFPHLSVTSVDLAPRHLRYLAAVRRGGVRRLTSVGADARALPFPDGRFDVVSALEVLEHIPDVEAAAREVVRVARRVVLASVPSHEDDNPEHVHLFTPDSLTRLLTEAGAARVSVDAVRGHLVAVARIQRP